MSILYLLAPLALLLGFFFLGAFLWGASGGQNDDLETPAHRMLLEDDAQECPKQREMKRILGER